MATATKTKPPKRKTEPDRVGPEPLLEVNTLAPDRPIATIDDVQHEFRLTQDFSAREHAQFNRDSRRFDDLFKADELTEDEEELMERLLDTLFRQSLVDPDRVEEQLGERLTGAIKREIVLTFSQAPLLQAMAQQTTDLMTQNSTTET